MQWIIYVVKNQLFMYTCTEKKLNWLKQIHFVDEKISRFNKISFVTTKPMWNEQNFKFWLK